MVDLRGIISDLMFTVSLLRQKIRKLESGEHITAMKKRFQQALDAEIKKNQALKKEIEALHKRIAKIQIIWQQVCDDLFDEINRIKEKHEGEMAKKQEEVWAAQKQRDEALDKARDRAKELYEAKVKLDEAEGRIQRLTVRVNKDHTNSSKPSSMVPNRPKIPNGRVATGRKRGGQPGHPHHPRKPHKADEVHEIPIPDDFKSTLRYRPTGKIISRQMISVKVITTVTEYTTPEYHDIVTGKKVHADFPAGYDNDVNYDGTVKAMAFMLNNECNVSIGKTKSFLKSISDGKLDLSTGMISNLTNEFARKTEAERDEIFSQLLSKPVLHTDFTSTRVNGKQKAVLITASNDGTVLYQLREKKGNEGVKGSPIETYGGTVVSDHDASLDKRGSRHQECMSHILRYIINSIQNEPNLKWNVKMKKWVKKTDRYWHEVNDKVKEYDPKVVDECLAEYDEIIALAQSEYEYEPPTKYYREGYNLFKRMRDDKQDYVLFLIDPTVPPSNNLAERHARIVKRKLHQMTTHRSDEHAEHHHEAMSVTQSIKGRGGDLYKEVVDIFER